MRALVFASLITCISVFGISSKAYALDMPDFIAETSVGNWIATENPFNWLNYTKK